ncbi:MAG: anhydro-N-acetylmuramic acid kinase AnmK [Candidatus Izemoplasmatales bacterium]|nr:anhydro-N-acetylmuramic acid kinase AnmK [Candidatus Izemoplasmatales bacterium]
MKKKAIGLMSGTSLDGIDIVFTEISGSGFDTQTKVLASNTYSYDEKLLKKLNMAMDINKSSVKLITSLNFEVAFAYYQAITKFCEDYAINLSEIDFIASHGQTIYHIDKNSFDVTASTLQIGDGSVLANLTNCTVVSAFRAADIAAGGKGAPLVPYFDYLMCSSKEKSRVLLNIGGISNITFLKQDSDINSIIAFDTGPGNMMIDEAVKRLYDKSYDESGIIAGRGKVIISMFEEIINHDYFKRYPPKTTGREDFGVDYTRYLLKKYKTNKSEDIVATLTNVTAYTISQALKDFIHEDIHEIYVSGGGSHNQTLIKLIKEYSKCCHVDTIDSLGISSDYKEALAFVVLANETLNHMPGNVPSATGAKRRVILGQVSYVIK